MCGVLCVVQEGVVLCDELCVVLFGVLCGGGVVWCVVCGCFISLFLSLSLSSLFLSILFFLFLALSLFFLVLSFFCLVFLFLFFLLPLSLLSSLLANKHCVKH